MHCRGRSERERDAVSQRLELRECFQGGFFFFLQPLSMFSLEWNVISWSRKKENFRAQGKVLCHYIRFYSHLSMFSFPLLTYSQENTMSFFFPSSRLVSKTICKQKLQRLQRGRKYKCAFIRLCRRNEESGEKWGELVTKCFNVRMHY